MDSPLAHYFLYTGHNSYLTGNQLSSDSSSKPIIKALRRGVRVIELDLWPNSEKNDVEVCHGGYRHLFVFLLIVYLMTKPDLLLLQSYLNNWN